MATNKELEEQLLQARKDIEKLAQMAGERARESAQDTVNAAHNKLDGLSSEAQAIYNQALSEGQRLRHNAEAHVRDNPLASTGLAFLAGAFVATLLGRR